MTPKWEANPEFGADGAHAPSPYPWTSHTSLVSYAARGLDTFAGSRATIPRMIGPAYRPPSPERTPDDEPGQVPDLALAPPLAPATDGKVDDEVDRLERGLAEVRDEVLALRADLAGLRREVRARRDVAPAMPSRDHATLSAAIDFVPSQPVADEPGDSLVARLLSGAVPWREGVTEARERVAAFGNAWALPRSIARADALDRRWEIAMAVAILLVAIVLRFRDLTGIPPGLHGDEALLGMEGQRVLAEGWIGPYAFIAAGSPTGTFYLSAVSQWLFGETIFAVRLIPALSGVLTVIALYALLRRAFGARVALVGSGLLAVMSWHVHFARIAFPNEAWPLVAVLATLALMEALRGDDWRWWAGSGALAALGLYTYNAHTFFLGVFGLFLLYRFYRWDALVPLATLGLYAIWPNVLTVLLLVGAVGLVLTSRRVRDRRTLWRAATVGAAFVLVALPMILFILDPANFYTEHLRRFSVFNQEEWRSLSGGGEKIDFFADRYRGAWRHLCCQPKADGIDASGVTPVVPRAMLLLVWVGVGLGLWRWRRRPLIAFGLLVILLMPLAPVVTVDEAIRRSLVMAPFLAMFAALGIVDGLAIARERGLAARIGITAVLVLAGSLAVYRNVDDYDKTYESVHARWVSVVEMTDASLFMDKLPATSHVYFYSDRWSVNYETRQFIAPDVSGEDRSAEFGGGYDLIPDPAQGDPVFIFIGAYLPSFAEVQRLYPGGEVIQGDLVNGLPTFLAYRPDPVSLSTPVEENTLPADLEVIEDPTPLGGDPGRG